MSLRHQKRQKVTHYSLMFAFGTASHLACQIRIKILVKEGCFWTSAMRIAAWCVGTSCCTRINIKSLLCCLLFSFLLICLFLIHDMLIFQQPNLKCLTFC